MCRKLLKSIIAMVASSDAGKFRSRRTEGLATVFLLHRAAGVFPSINGHDPGALERMVVDLKRRRFNFVSLQQVVDAARGQGSLPSGSIAFTVDDGYRDQIEVIAPIFVKHQVPLTIFLTTGLINGELWQWDAKVHWIVQCASQTSLEIKVGLHSLKWPLGSQSERINTRRELQAICAALQGEKVDDFVCSLEAAVGLELPQAPPAEFSPASWDQIRQLEDAGVRFAPHTHTHRILSGLTEAEIHYEMSRSLEIVMAETRHGLPFIAYPVGQKHQFGPREMHLAESMGFSAAFAVCEDYVRWSDSKIVSEQRYCLKRFGLPNTTPETLWLVSGLEALWETFVGSVKSFYGDIMNTDHALRLKPCPPRTTCKGWMTQVFQKLYFSLHRFDSLKCIHAERIERLVFVCRGNVCRSPYAEVAAKSFGLSSISCGTEVSCNLPAEKMAVRAALMRGKDISQHISRSIIDVPLDRSDCLVLMDPSHLPAAQEVAACAGCQITLLGLWGRPSVQAIADPYGRSLQDFCQCFDVIDGALAGLAFWIDQSQGERAKAIENEGEDPTKYVVQLVDQR